MRTIVTILLMMVWLKRQKRKNLFLKQQQEKL